MVHTFMPNPIDPIFQHVFRFRDFSIVQISEVGSDLMPPAPKAAHAFPVLQGKAYFEGVWGGGHCKDSSKKIGYLLVVEKNQDGHFMILIVKE